MRETVPEQLELGRDRRLSDPSYGTTGAFVVMGPCGAELRIIANDADDPETEGWEHVSVSTVRRCPNWIEMCFIKDLFWKEEELVIQYHVPESKHINNHPYVLHLWRDTLHPHPRMPPDIMVGVKGLSQDEIQKLAKQWWEDKQ